MKKFLTLILGIMLIMTCLLPCIAIAETADSATVDAPVVVDTPNIDVSEPFTWSYLATIAGAAVFTLLVVQFIKAPLDKVWKVPTRFLAYIIALATMLVATSLTTGLNIDNALLAAVNALLAAVSAYGMYEVTFAKKNK